MRPIRVDLTDLVDLGDLTDFVVLVDAVRLVDVVALLDLVDLLDFAHKWRMKTGNPAQYLSLSSFRQPEHRQLTTAPLSFASQSTCHFSTGLW